MSDGKWIIGRQPILDRHERLVAYELLFRSPNGSDAHAGDSSFATASVVLGVLSGFGVRQILGGRQGYINVDGEFLFSDAIELLPTDRIVLEILETVEPTEMVVERCRLLKAAGFHLALDDHRFAPSFVPLYSFVDTIKIDLTLSPPEDLAAAVQRFRAYPARLLAEKVESREQFRQCLDLGFDFFQGYYFARPSVLERRRPGDSTAILLKVLRLLVQGAETDQIDQALRQAPGLTYKLLVLLNSVTFGLREPIATVRHAIIMLGQQQMRRWVQLALLAPDDSGLDNPLLDAAAVRATFMEHLAGRLPRDSRSDTTPEQAFMVGILSFLDAIYDTPMEEIVRGLNLSDEVGAALTKGEGILGELLAFAGRMEHFELDQAFAELDRLGITPQDALEAQWRAFGWRSASL